MASRRDRVIFSTSSFFCRVRVKRVVLPVSSIIINSVVVFVGESTLTMTSEIKSKKRVVTPPAAVYFNNNNDIVRLTREAGKGVATAGGYAGQVCNWESRARTADPAFPVISRRRCCFIEMNERGGFFCLHREALFPSISFFFFVLRLMARITIIIIIIHITYGTS